MNGQPAEAQLAQDRPALLGKIGIDRAIAAVLTVLVTIAAFGVWFAVERRSPDYDPMWARDIAERQRVFGGSYYENGIHNKGPLEIWIPSMVRKVFGFDVFWFGIALVIMLIAVILGWSGAHLVRRLGGARWLAIAVAATIFIHFTLSKADYAGVLYSRNMTIGLLALALLCFLPADETVVVGRGVVGRFVLGGAAIGLAVQTLPTAALTGLCLLAFAVFAPCRVILGDRQMRVGRTAVAAAAVVFAAAPIYYRIFGPWREFWDGWYVYGQYMSASTGRSLRNQLGLGWHNFYLYTRDHMPAFIAQIGFVALGVARRRQLTRRQRMLHVLLTAWWLAAWLEITLTQRYSTHYFAVVALPAALMIAGCAVHVVAIAARAGIVVRRPAVTAHLLIVAGLFWSGTATLRQGVEAFDRFDGVHALAEARKRARDGQARAVQAVLDLTTRPDDPVQMWTSRPWWYLQFRRVSATRFIWKSFLMGETYLGRTSPDYILPGSWEHWASDIARANPQVFVIDNDYPMPGTTPADALLSQRFKPVLYTTRLDVALTPEALDPLTSAAEMTLFAGSPGTTFVDLGEQRCRRVDIVAEGPITIDFGGEQIVIADDEVVARSPYVEYMRSTAPAPEIVRVVTGTASVAVLFGEQVVAAMAYLPTVAMTVAAPRIDTLRTGALGGQGECRN